MKNDNGTILYEDRPSICSFSSVVGKKEAQGPFRDANLIESFMTEYSGVVEHLRRLKLNSVVGVN